jgi:hypothetical protein
MSTKKRPPGGRYIDPNAKNNDKVPVTSTIFGEKGRQ